MSTTHHDPESLLADLAWMRRLAVSLVADPAAADDVVQDTWLAALAQHWPGGRPNRAWLSRVLRNQVIDRRRTERRRLRREAASARPEAVAGAEDPVARLEAQRLLAEAVLELSEPTRTILLLRYQEDLSPAVIAERLGLPPGTVRSRISRGLQQLRGRLQSRFGGDHRAALAPILAAGAHPAVVGVVGVLLGAVTMKKTAVTLTALFAALATWYLVGPGQPFSDGLVADPPTVAAQRTAVGASAAGTPSASAGAEVRVAAGPTFGTAPGWWLEGAIHAPSGLGSARAGVRVRDARGRNPLELTGTVATEAAQRPVVGPVVGKAELDLGELFRHPLLLARGLRVEVDHPDYLPARIRLDLDRRLRQDGFLGKRSRIPFEVRLTPATALVVGKVRVPEGFPPDAVRVALFRGDGLAAGVEPVDHTTLRPDGGFRLRARDGVRYLAVAFAPETFDGGRTALRPQTLEVVAAERGEPLAFRLTPGEALRGRIPGLTRVEGVRYRLRASRSIVEESIVEESIVEEIETEVSETAERTEASAASGTGDAKGPVLLLTDVTNTPAPPPEVRLAPFVDLQGLAWIGSEFGDDWAFEYDSIHAWVDDAGGFEFTGLRRGRSYGIYELEPWSGGDRIPVQSPWDRGGLVSQEVLAPSQNLELGYTGRLVFVAMTRGGEPIDPYDCSLSLPRRWVEGGAEQTLHFPISPGPHGLLALQPPRSVEVLRGEVHAPACEPLEVAWQVGAWNRADLSRSPNTADLTLHLVGDEGRRVEALHVALKSPRGGELVRTLHHRVHKRLGPQLSIRDVPAGRWQLEVLPYASPALADYGTFTRIHVSTVTLAPGQRNFHRVPLEAGGYLEVPDPRRILSEDERGTARPEVGCRILDQRDEAVATGTVAVGPGSPEVLRVEDRRAGKLRLDAANRFFPMLAPGRYTLETFSLEAPDQRRRTGFEIRAGEVTRMGTAVSERR